MKRGRKGDGLAFDQKVGKRVREIRTKQGYRLWSLAEATGVAVSSMYAIEKGTRAITLYEAVRLCQALGLTFAELIE